MAKYKKLGETLVYKSKLAELYEDHLELPNGRQVTYDLIRHADGAAVLPIDAQGRLVLIRQYRNTVDDEVYEIPAGLREPEDATGEICARRELAEEAGYQAGRMEFIAQAYGTIGISTQKTDIYLAEQLTPCPKNPDPEEFIEVCTLELAEALAMIQRREIVDAKTIIAILYYQTKQ